MHSAKRAASRLSKPPTSRARGDALGLVDLVLSKKEFKTRSVLDHIAPQAFGFAAALLVRRVEKEKRRVWILCPDVKTQDHVHAELGVWQCPALYFPRLGHIVEGALAAYQDEGAETRFIVSGPPIDLAASKAQS